MRALQRLALAGVMALAVLLAPAAAAAPLKPSLAETLAIGVPYTGSMEGSKSQDWYHWLKLPATIRNGDVIQFSLTSSEPARVCLAPPVDDADRLDTQEKCDTNGYPSELPSVDIDGTRRRTLTWSGPAGVGFLLVASGDCCPYLNNGTYSLTLETINPNILIGMPPPSTLSRTFQLGATLQLGDNTPAGDGLAGELQWKRTRKTPGPSDWTTLASAISIAGQLTFAGQVPPEAQRKIQLRACALRPGGGANCTGVSTVALSPAETGKCRAATRLVPKLQKRIRRLKRKGSNRRGLRVARRQLVKSQRATRKYCEGA